jgi:uncharacterized membrane protein
MKVLCFPIVAIVLCSCAALAQTPNHSCAAVAHYKIVPLPLHPARINNSGVIAGTTEDNQPATWTQEPGLDEMKLPAGFDSAQVFGLNQSGDMVGLAAHGAADAGKDPDQTRAFEYSQGKFTLLSEAQSKAKAINAAGEVAGENSPDGPVAWTHGVLHRLGGCCGGRALALNNRGQIVGEANDQQGRFSAFLWDAAHGLQLVGPPGSSSSTALAINDAGHVLVQSLTPNAVFLREAGGLTPVKLSESASQPLALNNCDVIVGEYGANSEYYRAFIWDRRNGFRDLNQLADVGKDWVLESARDINDRGEIVGSGDHKNNDDTGFLLVPDVPLKNTKSRTTTKDTK